MIVVDTQTENYGARIRVIGVGGGGGNAIMSMIQRGLQGVEFIAANTDAQALAKNPAPTKIQIGRESTRGLGAGGKPEIGKIAAEETADDIREYLAGSDMIFVTAGMGGGTGTGGAPVVARIGRELGALVVGIVTNPFQFEAKKRATVAEQGIAELRQYVDALIVIPNQKLLSVIDRNTSFLEAFQRVDDVLYNATRGISDIISGHGYINVDFADVRSIMKDMGDALMGIGIASGEHRAAAAAQNALNSPLLEGVSIAGAQGLLVNISGGVSMTMHEIGEAVSIIEEAAGSEVNLIHGIVFDETLDDKIMITVVATGFKRQAGSGSTTHVPAGTTGAVPIHTPPTPSAPPVIRTAPGGNFTGAVGGSSLSTGSSSDRSTIRPVAATYAENPATKSSSTPTSTITAQPQQQSPRERIQPVAVENRQPGFVRRSAAADIRTANTGSIAINTVSDIPAGVTVSRPMPVTNREIRSSVIEKPAFLRKIMD